MRSPIIGFLLVLLPFFGTTGILQGQVSDNDFTYRCFRPDAIDSLSYKFFVPRNYDPSVKYPLVLMLHGSRENDNAPIYDISSWKLSDVMMTFAQEYNQVNYPCIVLEPLCQSRGWSSKELDYTVQVIRQLSREYSVDPTRLYVTGPSMGGYGTWSMIVKYPKMFAVAVPLCGGNYPQNAYLVKDVHTWIFHSADDKTVPVSESRTMYNAMLAAGAPDVRYTEYNGYGHAVWLAAYKEPALFAWMFMNKLITDTRQLSQRVQINVSPNPTRGLLQIQVFPERSGSISYSLNDLAGVTIYKSTVQNSSSMTETIDLSKYPKGVYILNLQVENKLIKKKIVLD